MNCHTCIRGFFICRTRVVDDPVAFDEGALVPGPPFFAICSCEQGDAILRGGTVPADVAAALRQRAKANGMSYPPPPPAPRRGTDRR